MKFTMHGISWWSISGYCCVSNFQSLQATFQAVKDANKTLDKPVEACQG